MAHGLVADAIGHKLGIAGEEFRLLQSEAVLRGIFRHTEVGENALDFHFRSLLQVLHQFRQLIAHKAQPMHSGVQFDVDGIVLEALLPQYFHQFLKRV